MIGSVLGVYANSNSKSDFLDQLIEIVLTKRMPSFTVTHLDELPDYDGENQEIMINEDRPDFTEAELSLSRGAWATYGNLDYLNRVGTADAVLGKELMPKTQRERLYINPSGWHQLKLKEGNMLYNRSHLIAYQLTGENNNPKNLMTGTQSLNSSYMRLYEERVAKYIRETGNHVRYRVTPYFRGTELLARGVQMEAQSIEDDQLRYNVFIYNVQDGVTINYQTGRAFNDGN